MKKFIVRALLFWPESGMWVLLTISILGVLRERSALTLEDYAEISSQNVSGLFLGSVWSEERVVSRESGCREKAERDDGRSESGHHSALLKEENFPWASG